MKIDKTDVQKALGTVLLIASAVGAFIDVFDKDKKEKEFEELKKAVADLQSKKD